MSEFAPINRAAERAERTDRLALRLIAMALLVIVAAAFGFFTWNHQDFVTANARAAKADAAAAAAEVAAEKSAALAACEAHHLDNIIAFLNAETAAAKTGTPPPVFTFPPPC